MSAEIANDSQNRKLRNQKLARSKVNERLGGLAKVKDAKMTANGYKVRLSTNNNGPIVGLARGEQFSGDALSISACADGWLSITTAECVHPFAPGTWGSLTVEPCQVASAGLSNVPPRAGVKVPR